METKVWVHYVGGHIDYPNRSSRVLTITPTEVEFKSSEFVMNQYHFKFSTEKLQSTRLQTTREISAARMLVVGPLLATAMKKEIAYVVVEYEDESGLQQTLLFDVPGDKDNIEKKELIHKFQEAFVQAKKERI